MKDGELIKTHKFEYAYQAWEFMVKNQNKRQDRLYTIPREEADTVEEYYRVYEELKEEKGFKPACPYVVSDSFQTIHGIKNMADGKQYDSKAAYYQSVKDAGCVVVGNDESIKKQKPVKEKHDINWHQEVKKTLDTLSSKKGKRK